MNTIGVGVLAVIALVWCLLPAHISAAPPFIEICKSAVSRRTIKSAIKLPQLFAQFRRRQPTNALPLSTVLACRRLSSTWPV